MGSAGFVLTGGASRRMGRDKALLPYGGATPVEVIASRVAAAAGSVALAGAPERYGSLGIETLPESYPGRGPLSGIEAALALGRAEWNLIAACDLAGVSVESLRALLEAARALPDAVVAAQHAPQRPNPLCAVWRPRALPVVREMLARGQYRVWEAALRAGLATVALHEPVLNVNTPADWAAAGGR